jgi:undecaprenyl phosphate-alpha-L-ara4N flippase subunit ArnE
MSPKQMIWISVALTSLAQVSLKLGLTRIQRAPKGGFGLLAGIIRDGYVWIWGLLFTGGTALWLLGLRHLDLSYAYPLLSLGYVLVAALAALFFRERISLERWIAIVVICLGVYLISGS